MLVFDFRTIGNKLLAIRKKAGLTQSEVAEKANLSDRTYADIERGTVNMRIETVLKICEALHITPDMLLTTESPDISVKLRSIYSMARIIVASVSFFPAFFPERRSFSLSSPTI